MAKEDDLISAIGDVVVDFSTYSADVEAKIKAIEEGQTEGDDPKIDAAIASLKQLHADFQPKIAAVAAVAGVPVPTAGSATTSGADTTSGAISGTANTSATSGAGPAASTGLGAGTVTDAPSTGTVDPALGASGSATSGADTTLATSGTDSGIV